MGCIVFVLFRCEFIASAFDNLAAFSLTFNILNLSKNLKPKISAAVFATKPPQLLKPIITSKGVHLILVEEIVQPELNNVLRLQIMSDLFGAWIKEQVEEVEIDVVLQENKLVANVA